MASLDLMGLLESDFDWYSYGAVPDLVARNIPQIKGEYEAEGEELTIMILNQLEVSDFNSFKVAFWFRNAYLPVYESGDFYVKVDGSLATRKNPDGWAFLGIRKQN